MLSSAGATVRIAPQLFLERPRTHFLYFHSLHASDMDRFHELISRLSNHGEFVSYSDAVESASENERAASDVKFCVSVDDGFASCTNIAEVADRFGISVCFFIPTGLVGSTTRAEVATYFGSDLHIENSALSWDDVDALQSRGHEIGSHTVTHANLASISQERLEDELMRSKQELEHRCGPVQHFAWPYGTARHAPPNLVETAAGIGYASVASAIRGAHRSPLGLTSQFILRDHCPPDWPLSHNLAFIARSARLAA
jgi:peptidoglycan/xylan/chitin deacetylase (PgdA/CDA1 family)